MLKILKRLKGREWLRILISFVFIVGQVWLDLKLPEYMSEITRLVQIPGSNPAEIWITGGYMLLCALGSAAMAVVVGFFAARIAASFSMSLREDIFNKVESFSMEEIQKFSTASLITRSTNDVTQIQMLIAMGLQVMIKAPIMATWAIIKILGKSWQWSAATAVAVMVLIIMILVIIIFALPKFKKMQTLTDNLNKVTRENLTGIRVVRAYNSETFEEEKFNRANDELTKTQLFTNRLMAIMSPGMGIIMSGLSLSIYWIGAYLINMANILDKIAVFSDMIVFSSYAMQVVISFVMLTMIFIMLPRATVSARRVNEVLSTASKMQNGSLTGGDRNGEVKFINVGFKYPNADEYVLKNINFIAKKGETVAFVGSTGSGKSTLINLVPRFYDATEGEVLVGGVNVKDYDQKSLYNRLGYVSQKAVLFSGSIESNISYGDNGREKPTSDEIRRASELAQSLDFIEEKEGGFAAVVSQNGTNFSGGQKQRLSIARAIARKPDILIFDDAFSALDYKTDRNLRFELKQHSKDTTNLIVAQRIGTIRDADKIIVLEKGEIVGEGKHRELLKTCKVYREIAYSQLSKEELKDE